MQFPPPATRSDLFDDAGIFEYPFVEINDAARSRALSSCSAPSCVMRFLILCASHARSIVLKPRAVDLLHLVGHRLAFVRLQVEGVRSA